MEPFEEYPMEGKHVAPIDVHSGKFVGLSDPEKKV